MGPAARNGVKDKGKEFRILISTIEISIILRLFSYINLNFIENLVEFVLSFLIERIPLVLKNRTLLEPII